MARFCVYDNGNCFCVDDEVSVSFKWNPQIARGRIKEVKQNGLVLDMSWYHNSSVIEIEFSEIQSMKELDS